MFCRWPDKFEWISRSAEKSSSRHWLQYWWIFQEDNAPVHRLKVSIIWFKSKKINILPWPSLSRELNPVENMWELHARKVYSEGMLFRIKEQ